jgi:hypothetical protein
MQFIDELGFARGIHNAVYRSSVGIARLVDKIGHD